MARVTEVWGLPCNGRFQKGPASSPCPALPSSALGGTLRHVTVDRKNGETVFLPLPFSGSEKGSRRDPQAPTTCLCLILPRAGEAQLTFGDVDGSTFTSGVWKGARTPLNYV